MSGLCTLIVSVALLSSIIHYISGQLSDEVVKSWVYKEMSPLFCFLASISLAVIVACWQDKIMAKKSLKANYIYCFVLVVLTLIIT